jgi:uncharacterized protein YlxP (DUF503 family)
MAVSAGYIGILSVELHFPEAGSLKGKRKYVKSAKAQLQQRFGASGAERYLAGQEFELAGVEREIVSLDDRL